MKADDSNGGRIQEIGQFLPFFFFLSFPKRAVEPTMEVCDIQLHHTRIPVGVEKSKDKTER